MLTYSATFAAALLAAFAVTPLVRPAARVMGLVDRPDPERKLHRGPIPLGGGCSVLIASLVGVAVALVIGGRPGEYLWQSGAELSALLIAAVVILAVGLADDRRSLRGRQKLSGQILAVAIVMYAGLVIHHVKVFDWTFDLGLMAIPFTMFWLLGAINSLNLLDGADGFATTIGIVVCGAIAVMAGYTGHYADAAVAAAVTGALCGFLFFNFPPASIFLGDGGSMLIGLAAGTLAIRAALKGPATVALAAPLAVLAIPIFDSAAAVIRRWFTGRSLYIADRGHLHHVLLRLGLQPRALVPAVATLCAATAIGGLVSIAMHNEMCALAAAGTVLGVLVVSRVFGFRELMLVASRALAFGNSLMTSSPSRRRVVHQEMVQLQGSRSWDQLWGTLTGFAEQHELTKVDLDLNLPWLHEGLHARWHSNEKLDPLQTWSTRVPLASGKRKLGCLVLAGATNNGTCHELLSLVAELVESIQPCVSRLALELPGDILDPETDEEAELVETDDQPPEPQFAHRKSVPVAVYVPEHRART